MCAAHFARLDGEFEDATASILEGITSSTKTSNDDARHAEYIAIFMWSRDNFMTFIIYMQCKLLAQSIFRLTVKFAKVNIPINS